MTALRKARIPTRAMRVHSWRPDVREQYSFPDGSRGWTEWIKSRERAAEFIFDYEISPPWLYPRRESDRKGESCLRRGEVVHHLAKPMIFDVLRSEDAAAN
jgi:hypothetical protein